MPYPRTCRLWALFFGQACGALKHLEPVHAGLSRRDMQMKRASDCICQLDHGLDRQVRVTAQDLRDIRLACPEAAGKLRSRHVVLQQAAFQAYGKPNLDILG